MSTKNQSRRPQKAKRGMPVAAIVIIVVITVLIVAAAGGVYYLLNLYKPSLPNVDPGNVPIDPNESVTTDENGNLDPDDVRKKDLYNFLVLGKDVGGTNTDVFMLVSFQVKNDSAEPEITVMQIPRDTYVEADGNHYKINSLYTHMRSKARTEKGLSGNDLLDEAMKGVADAVSQSMNVAVDYTVLMDLEGFRNIVDCIGGVYMYVPCDMDYDDEAQDLYIHLKQGYQTLNGVKAEQFIRFRKGFKLGDLSRVEAQKLFMAALVRQIKDSLSVSTVAQIAEQAIKYVSSSLSAPDLVYFAKEFFSVDDSHIVMLTCPGEATYVGRASYYVVHREELRYTVNRYFNVYLADVPDDMFDRGYAFVTEDDEEVMKIYNTAFDPENDTSKTHSVDDISENGIPLV